MTGEHLQRPSESSSHARPEPKVSLELRYRSVAAFLCAYSSRLSRGEVFLETEKPLPRGTRTALRLLVPGTPPLDIEGSVIWNRIVAIGPGQPAGMGIALSSSIEAHGAIIDELAGRYSRIRILVVGAARAPRAVIGRYLRSILACDAIEVAPPPASPGNNPGLIWGPVSGLGEEIAKEIETGIDLAVVDMDADRVAGETVIRRLKIGGATADLAVIALAQLERDRALAAAMGADEVLTTPPLFSELRTAVIHGLSQPRSWASR